MNINKLIQNKINLKKSTKVCINNWFKAIKGSSFSNFME